MNVEQKTGNRNATSVGASETAANAVARRLDWRRGETIGETPSPVMDIDVDDGGILHMNQEGDTLIVSGDIDLYQAQEFRDRAEDHITATAQPRLDMSRVPFLDSAGLAALLALSRTAQAQGKALRMIITGSPRRVLKITGIDRVLVLED